MTILCVFITINIIITKKNCNKKDNFISYIYMLALRRRAYYVLCAHLKQPFFSTACVCLCRASDPHSIFLLRSDNLNGRRGITITRLKIASPPHALLPLFTLLHKHTHDGISTHYQCMCVCDNFIFGFCSASGGVDDNNDGGDGGGGTVSPAHQHTHKTLAAFLVKKDFKRT